MVLPVLIEPLPNQNGFTARFVAPIGLSAEAPTPEEAQRRLAALLNERLHQGVQLSSMTVPDANQGGWLPDDELTQEWLRHVEQFRKECDAADRARFQDDASQGATVP